MSKIVTAAEAAALVPSGAVLGVDGFVGSVCPEELLLALEARFLETGEPEGLTVIASTGSGDTRGRGLDRLRHDGMIRRLLTSYLNLNRMLQRRLIDNEIEGYLLPLGAIVQLYREIAAGRPGLVTHVGLGTFVDPEHGGGKVNARTVEDYVERVRLSGRDWLFYPSMRLDAGLLRGTTADPDGNITMEREIGTFQGPSFAQAVRNSGGAVLAQVERIAERGSLDPRRVVIPGHLVDRVVVARPENHPQTFATAYDPVFSGEVRADMSAQPPQPLSVKKVIGRRAAMELRRGDVVNLGVGRPNMWRRWRARRVAATPSRSRSSPAPQAVIRPTGFPSARRSIPVRSSTIPTSSTSTTAAGWTSLSSAWRSWTPPAMSMCRSSGRAFPA